MTKGTTSAVAEAEATNNEVAPSQVVPAPAVGLHLLEQELSAANQRMLELQTQIAEQRQSHRASLITQINEAEAEYSKACNDLLSAHKDKMTLLQASLKDVLTSLGIQQDVETVAVAIAPTVDLSSVTAPEGIAKEEYRKLLVRHWNPRSLNQHVLMVLSNAGEGNQLSIDVIGKAVVANGHTTRSGDYSNMRSSVSTTIHQLKKDGSITSKERGRFQITKAGAKLAAKLTKAAGGNVNQGAGVVETPTLSAATTIAASAPSFAANEIPSGLKYGKLDNYVLLALYSKGGEFTLPKDIMIKIHELGYTSDASPDSYSSAVSNSTRKLREAGYVLPSTADGKKLYKISASGRVEAEKIQAAARSGSY